MFKYLMKRKVIVYVHSYQINACIVELYIIIIVLAHNMYLPNTHCQAYYFTIIHEYKISSVYIC